MKKTTKCIKCNKSIYETVHTADSYNSTQYAKCYPMLEDSGLKDEKKQPILIVKIKKDIYCKKCFENV